MPIFEYQCQECSSLFEKIVYDRSEEIECPQCGSRSAEKQLSSFAVQADGQKRVPEPGSCPCGAEQRGMCQMMSES